MSQSMSNTGSKSIKSFFQIVSNHKRDFSAANSSSDVNDKKKHQRTDEPRLVGQPIVKSNSNTTKHSLIPNIPHNISTATSASDNMNVARIVDKALGEVLDAPRTASASEDSKMRSNVDKGLGQATVSRKTSPVLIGPPTSKELKPLRIENRGELLLRMQYKRRAAQQMHGELKVIYQTLSITDKSHPVYDSLRLQYKSICDLHLNNYGGLLLLCQALKANYNQAGDNEITLFAENMISKINKIVKQLQTGTYAIHNKF